MRAGADEIVSPDFTGGHRIASLMVRPQLVSLGDELRRSGGPLSVEEVAVPQRPLAGETIAPGDVLIVIASQDGLRQLEQMLAI